MSARPLTVMLVATALLSLAAPAWAQGTITGMVRDVAGAVLPGVVIDAYSEALAAPRRAMTNREGRYELTDLPVGRYTLSFTLPGFTVSLRTVVIETARQPDFLDIVLAPGGLPAVRTMTPFVPRAACNMPILPADPTLDPKIRTPVDQSARYTMKPLPAPLCR